MQSSISLKAGRLPGGSIISKVCFLSSAQYSTPLDETSEKKFHALAAEHDVLVVSFSTSVRPRAFTQHARFYLLPWVPVAILRYLLLLVAGPWVALWCLLRHDASILVAQSPYEGVPAGWAKLGARLLGKRVRLVVESHGDFEVSVFLQRRVFSRRLYHFLMNLAIRSSLGRADLLRAVSKATSRQLRQWSPELRIVEFPAWTDIEVFLEAHYDPDEGNQRILFVGVLFPRKGVHHLVSAFSIIAQDCPAAELVIVGREENVAYVAKLKDKVARLGLNDRVKFVGEMSQRSLANWMSQSLVLVLPSLSEGFGRVVIEAMAAGTSVIGSMVDGIPELIRDKETGFLVPPEDVDALGDRLHWVLTHPKESKDMGRCAREFVRNFFSTDAYLRGYAEVFEAAQSTVLSEPKKDNAEV